MWTLIATVLRNILLNWLVLIPLLMAVLMLPRLYLSILSYPNLVYEGVDATGCPDYSAAQFNSISDSPFVKYLLPVLSLVLFATALLNTLRYLPSVGGRDHSRFDYAVKILAPLVGAALTYLIYLGEHYSDYTRIGAVVLWTILPCAAAWLLYLPFDPRTLPQRLRLFFGPLSLAVAAMAVGTGAGTWAFINYVLWSPDCQQAPSWAAYVTIGPAMMLGFCLGTVLFVGLSGTFLKDEDREWMSRAVARPCCSPWRGRLSVDCTDAAQWALTWRMGPKRARGCRCAERLAQHRREVIRRERQSGNDRRRRPGALPSDGGVAGATGLHRAPQRRLVGVHEPAALPRRRRPGRARPRSAGRTTTRY